MYACRPLASCLFLFTWSVPKNKFACCKCYLGCEVYFKINLLLVHIVVNQDTVASSWYLENQLSILFSLSWYVVAYSTYSAQALKFGAVVPQVLSNKRYQNTKEKNNLVVTVSIF
jgi:hypothetical protein